ncbi:MAG: winged helix DNA-binding domain-containing protein [Chloroflexota bacterium]
MSDVGMLRLYSQRITDTAFKDAGQVVAWLGAMQGQDYAGTKWAFGLRLGEVTDRDIEQALTDGIILRTWALRGTLHYVAPADIHWLLALIAPRQIAGNARRYKQLELDDVTLTRSTRLIADALHEASLLTRSELFAILTANGISTAGQRGVYMLQRAALERLVYQGPVRRNETTFRALAPGTVLPKDHALAELARRYFMSHGPTTLNDFTAWSGLLISEARTGLEAVRSELAEEKIDDQTYFLSPEKPKALDPSVYLLPGFDEFVLGYRDRSAVLEAQFADAICPGGNGMFTPTLVSEGRIIGTWKRTIKSKIVEIAFTLFRPLSVGEEVEVQAAAARFGTFLGLSAKLIF